MNRVTGTTFNFLKASVLVIAVVVLSWFAMTYFWPILKQGDEVVLRHRRIAYVGVAASSILWLVGWWYVLFGKSEEGVVFRTTTRGNHILLGGGMIALTIVLAYAVHTSAELK